MKNHNFATLLALFLPCIILQMDPTQAIYSVSMPHYLSPKSYIIQSENIITSPGQVYGFCSRIAHRNSQDLCIMYMETDKNIGTRDHLRSCNYVFKPYQTAGAIRLIALNENKAILLVSSRSTIMGILDFSDCSYKPIEMTEHDNVRYANVYAPFAGTFDIVLYGQNNYCRGEGVCKFVVDFDGNIVMGTGHRQWIENNDMNFKAMMYSKTKGRLVVDTYESLFECKARVKAIDNYGEIETLKEYSSDKLTNTQGCTISASATNHYLSVCSLVNSNSICSQFDPNGNIKFETTFNLNLTAQYHSMKVHNLPGGGLLFLVFECSDYHLDCDKMKRDFMVYKIDAVGYRNGSLEITQLQCIEDEVRDKIHFFVNEAEEMCLSLMCNKSLTKDKTSLDIVCFKDTDFNS